MALATLISSLRCVERNPNPFRAVSLPDIQAVSQRRVPLLWFFHGRIICQLESCGSMRPQQAGTYDIAAAAWLFSRESYSRKDSHLRRIVKATVEGLLGRRWTADVVIVTVSLNCWA